MRIKVYNGKTRPQLTENELEVLVPNWGSLEEVERVNELEPRATDEKIYLDGKQTLRSVVIQVAKNMSKEIDPDNDTEVEALLSDFANLSEENRIKYGVWGGNTNEYGKQQALPAIREREAKVD